MIKVKIKGNEKLFNRIKQLGIQTQTLSTIVQNDTELTPSEIQQWVELSQEAAVELNNIQLEVIKYLTKAEFL